MRRLAMQEQQQQQAQQAMLDKAGDVIAKGAENQLTSEVMQ